MLERLKLNIENRQKQAFYASDYGKSAIDLYFAFKGIPPTNPPSWNETLKWGAGRGVEDQMLTVLKNSGIVKTEYDQKEHGRIERVWKDIKIHGYIDALTINEFPVEIKSVNNKNSYDILKYQRGYPRESYVGQLSTYIDFLKKDKGFLFVSTVDGLSYFWLECNKVYDGMYKCGNVIVNLYEEYDRWNDIYTNYILKDIMPDIFQYRYKYDVSTLDWKTQSRNAIAKARANKAVIGDFQVQYSPWKDKIVELQGTTLGYTNEELSIIHEKTAGYTTWGKE